MKSWSAALVIGLVGCASTADRGGPAPKAKLSLESTADDVYRSCVKVEAEQHQALYDCGEIELALNVGDDGDAFLDGRLAAAIARVGAGPVRAAPFLLPVGGESSTVLRTVVYADPDETQEAMVHMGVLVPSSRLALSCVARAGLPGSGDLCARVIDQVALSPPSDLDMIPPAPKGAVEVNVAGVVLTIPPDCDIAAADQASEITCPFSRATLRSWTTAEEAQSAAHETAEVLGAYGAEVNLKRLSCQLLRADGGCLVGEVSTPEGAQGLVLGSAKVGERWISLECTAPTGISDPLCRALVVVH